MKRVFIFAVLMALGTISWAQSGITIHSTDPGSQPGHVAIPKTDGTIPADIFQPQKPLPTLPTGSGSTGTGQQQPTIYKPNPVQMGKPQESKPAQATPR